jgi:PAS domain S-box-containing protein
MTREEILYLIPYFTSIALSAGILAYTWNKLQVTGATAFAWYLLGQILWSAGFIFELLSKDISNKIFWDGFQWLAGFLALIALPVFAVQHTERQIRHSKILFQLSFVAPALFILCLFLDQKFHWIYANPDLTLNTPFRELLYGFSPLVYGFAAYAYLVILWALYILIYRILRLQGLYQVQTALIALGVFIPIFSAAFGLLRIDIAPQRDATSLASAFGNLIIAWGLFRFNTYEIPPVVRDKVFEAMVEPVVILDNQNMIVDINLSMLDLLGETANSIIGRPAKEVFEGFPIPIKQYTQTSYARAEAIFEIRGKEIHYEMTVWPMYDTRKNMTGRIFISHDITALKDIERDLHKINAELEDRVRARTYELEKAYDTTLEGWARALELRDKETEGHTRRVTDMTLKIAVAMGITGDDLEQIRRGAILHDIGKMGIADKILLKPGELTSEERAIIQEHPSMAHQLLSPIPFLKKALDIPCHHHEKWDGSGYPHGLKGEEIPIAARIFAVVDVWDAVNSERPYKKAWSRGTSIAYLIEQTGRHFDPKVINVFLEMLEKGEI